jgi:hypothetical protein
VERVEAPQDGEQALDVLRGASGTALGLLPSPAGAAAERMALRLARVVRRVIDTLGAPRPS